MSVAGKRIKRTRLVQSERYVVAVEVEMVIPEDDPGEPCDDPDAVMFLRDVADHAARGDLDWLRQRGKVYQLLDAA